MIPLSVPASIARTCWCMCGGKKSMRRLTVSEASTVWTVEKTRWPVSAADSAVCTVSSSRISPMRMTSGSWRRTRRSARLNEAVSWPTSRWLISERLSWCRNSIGSSIVTTCRARVELMWSIIAASVVDLPEPVVPVSSTMPRSSSASVATTSGSDEVLDRADVHRDRAGDDRHVAALAEGVDAEPRDVLDRVAEVDLVVVRELAQLVRVVEHLMHRGLGLLGASSSGRPSIGRRAPSIRVIGGAPAFRWRSDPSLWTR